ncbi:MAG: co-chaperone GroES [Chloroflexota bacterium]|uniref:10 kDa chaperonin n=1 Tax=marine metagenome TaxID=408172 RepID=A0A381QRS1_9ZZZZ|nr:co-chaperone GroES [Chloroflexota bacterium]
MTTSAKSATDLKPMGDRVVVRPSEQEGVTKSGIFLPDTAQERPQQGKVVAAGPGRMLKNGKRIEMEVKPGDIVIYSKYAGTEVEVQDEELLVLGANDVLAVIT